MSIIFLAVAFLGPLALGIWGFRSRIESSDTASDTDGTFACHAPWALVVNSAVVYALAYNLTFLLQELSLVIPKAICGLQPILYHNNHRWLVADPIADLLQGSGALGALISGLVFLGILSRQSKSRGLFKLFSIWMVYQGLSQSLHQFASVVLNPDGDVADAFRDRQEISWTIWGPSVPHIG